MAVSAIFPSSSVRYARARRSAEERARTCKRPVARRHDLVARDRNRAAAASSKRRRAHLLGRRVQARSRETRRASVRSGRWKFDIPRSSDLMSPEHGVSLGYALALCHAAGTRESDSRRWGGKERGEKSRVPRSRRDESHGRLTREIASSLRAPTIARVDGAADGRICKY